MARLARKVFSICLVDHGETEADDTTRSDFKGNEVRSGLEIISYAGLIDLY